MDQQLYNTVTRLREAVQRTRAFRHNLNAVGGHATSEFEDAEVLMLFLDSFPQMGAYEAPEVFLSRIVHWCEQREAAFNA